MSEGKVARRYAKALIEVASEAGAIEQVEKELEGFLSAVNANNELKQVIHSPVFSVDERVAIVEALAKNGSWGELTHKIIMLLVKLPSSGNDLRRCCQSSSVMNGMNGCSRRNDRSKTCPRTLRGLSSPARIRTFASSIYQSANSFQMKSWMMRSASPSCHSPNSSLTLTAVCCARLRIHWSSMCSRGRFVPFQPFRSASVSS